MIERRFSVALSFASEDRELARKLAGKLESAGVKVFFDEQHQHELWGRNLQEELDEVYKDGSDFVIVFWSDAYTKSMWTSYERQIILERYLKKNGKGEVLPLRVNGYKGRVSGFTQSIGYVEITTSKVSSVVDLLLKKIGSEPVRKDLNKSSRPQATKSKIILALCLLFFSGMTIFLYSTISFCEEEHSRQVLVTNFFQPDLSFQKELEGHISFHTNVMGDVRVKIPGISISTGGEGDKLQKLTNDYCDFSGIVIYGDVEKSFVVIRHDNILDTTYLIITEVNTYVFRPALNTEFGANAESEQVALFVAGLLALGEEDFKEADRLFQACIDKNLNGQIEDLNEYCQLLQVVSRSRIGDESYKDIFADLQTSTWRNKLKSMAGLRRVLDAVGNVSMGIIVIDDAKNSFIDTIKCPVKDVVIEFSEKTNWNYQLRAVGDFDSDLKTREFDSILVIDSGISAGYVILAYKIDDHWGVFDPCRMSIELLHSKTRKEAISFIYNQYALKGQSKSTSLERNHPPKKRDSLWYPTGTIVLKCNNVAFHIQKSYFEGNVEKHFFTIVKTPLEKSNVMGVDSFELMKPMSSYKGLFACKWSDKWYVVNFCKGTKSQDFNSYNLLINNFNGQVSFNKETVGRKKNYGVHDF